MKLDCAGKPLDLNIPRVMGVLNVTPDSFSDGGVFFSLDAARRQAGRMAAEGAAIIDIGGESTRPGARPVSVAEELDRVIPVIEALHHDLDIPLSIDTSKAEVMKAAVVAGAGLINDVRALREPGALEVAVASHVPVCLMHMRGEPRSMQKDVHYADVTTEVIDFLRSRVQACLASGIDEARILIDPGFGFGKDLDHNLQLFRDLPRFVELGFPVLVGVSRKTMIGKILGHDVGDRLYGSIALATLAASRGAALIRAHDVGATVDAIRICQAIFEKEMSDHG
ncbi:MAG: dihydropteroate synthase [Gammaproteobacteria bacterium]|nr:dihydropteroate synthase [Gammaproteobacteria bacterium]